MSKKRRAQELEDDDDFDPMDLIDKAKRSKENQLIEELIAQRKA